MELLDRICALLVRQGYGGAFNFAPIDISILPNELFVKILRSLDTKTLKTCRYVCKEWNSVIVDHPIIRNKRLLLTQSGRSWEAALFPRERHTWSCLAIPTFPPWFRFVSIHCDEPLSGMTILKPALQSPQSDLLQAVDIQINEANRSDPEFQNILRLLMKNARLEDLTFRQDSKESNDSASFLTNYSRIPHRKLYRLDLHGMTVSLNYACYFLDHICENLCADVRFSPWQFERILRFFISRPREAFLSRIHSISRIAENLVECLTYPKFSQFSVNRVEGGYRLDINAQWKLIISGLDSKAYDKYLNVSCRPSTSSDLVELLPWWA